MNCCHAPMFVACAPHHHHHCHHQVCPTCGRCECCGVLVRWPICAPAWPQKYVYRDPWPYPHIEQPHVIYTNTVTVHESSARAAINALAG